MEYKIISAFAPDELCFQVNQNIKDGWRPQGGISVDKTAFGTFFRQAMIKEK
jgi:hypothetical protein